MSELVPPGGSTPLPVDREVDEALRGWIEDLEPHTRKAYERGLCQFAGWLLEKEAVIESTPEAAGRYLLGLEHGPANAVVQAYLQDLSRPDPDTGRPRYVPGTVSNRLSALRWAVKQARRMGLCTWALDVTVPKPSKDANGRIVRKAGRDMTGPGEEAARAMVAAAFHDDDFRAAFVVCSIFHETLRAHEIRQLDLCDVDLEGSALTLVRKKRTEQMLLPMSTRTREAARLWIEHRGPGQGPFLYGGSAGSDDESRIGVNGVGTLIRRIGEECGVSTSPHRLRHTAITVGERLATLLGIKMKDRMERSGHSDERTYQRYIDADLEDVRRLLEAVATGETEDHDDD